MFKCSLQAVDNYGFLNLDIAYLYFKLRDPTFMKDAEWRLIKAKECFERVHGKNLEFLKEFKETYFVDIAAYVRLLLLQGVLAFHKGEKQKAAFFLDSAETKLKTLTVDDELVAMLMSMGFTSSESRLGLLVSDNNIDAAAAAIFKKQEDKRIKQEQERTQLEERRQQRRYGKTANGSWVKPSLVQALIGMGFAKKLVVQGLKQTNNDYNQALVLMTESPHLLRVKDKRRKKIELSEESLLTLLSMGYSESQARGTLQATDNNVEEAVSLLISGNGIEEEPEKVVNNDVIPPENNEGPQQIPQEENRKENEIEEEDLREAERELIEELPQEGEIDFNVEEELNILTEYKALLYPAQ